MYLVAKPNITLLKKALGEKLGSTITGFSNHRRACLSSSIMEHRSWHETK